MKSLKIDYRSRACVWAFLSPLCWPNIGRCKVSTVGSNQPTCTVHTISMQFNTIKYILNVKLHDINTIQHMPNVKLHEKWGTTTQPALALCIQFQYKVLMLNLSILLISIQTAKQPNLECIMQCTEIGRSTIF